MFISVLICTCNRADSLRQILDSLFCPTNLQSMKWETVVVDNDSSDDTVKVCQDFGERFPEHFRSLVEKRHGKSIALNTAIGAAKGDVLAFTDDDMLLAPDYIQGIRTVFTLYPIDAAQGRILLDCEGGSPDWLDRYLGFTVGWRDCGDEVVDLDGTLCGGNMVVRAEVFQKIGGFASELGPAGTGMGETLRSPCACGTPAVGCFMRLKF
jgi:glycosyltransferase involved in cell wall biosynthesis